MYENTLVVGIPRSGYALTNTIIKKILNYAQKGATNSEKFSFIHRIEPILSEYLYHQYSTVFKKHNVATNLLVNGEFKRIMGGPQWLADGKNCFGVRKYFGLKDIGDILLTHNFHPALFNYYSHVHSHENPKIWIENSKFNHYLKITTLRNPAGILNSSVHSLNALTSEYIQKYLPRENETVLREQVAINKLSDLGVIEGLIDFQLNYFNNLLSVQGAYHTVYWENIIEQPIQSILEIANLLTINIPNQVAKNIWASMDHRNTFISHKHNFRENKGIVGDWNNCLTNEHIELLKSKGFDQIAMKLGYPEYQYFDESQYSTFQKQVSDNLKSNYIPPIIDENLRTFSFNKSNIDDSNFGFKKYLGNHASITRFACPDQYNTLAKDLLETSEFATEKVNKILTTIDNTSKADDAFTQCKESLKALAIEIGKESTYITAEHLTQDFYQQNALRLIQLALAHQPIAIWGISKDFDNLVNANIKQMTNLIKNGHIQLFDLLEAQNIIWGAKVKSSTALAQFNGKIILTPSAISVRNSMKSIAKQQGFIEKVVDIYENN
ncbi:sulfotransferase domain-containing protein [Thalassotalea sp. G2M2-11]|uniref:sulfotransferase domain-containing protein n=1 Tax=Thalassotalea sp. G2M2-11 TaxID=2787627 RepID=UPI0019CF8065|nr:sulfotransferase domain-containing protein [Thalassotalea sp. G2M2-11]